MCNSCIQTILLSVLNKEMSASVIVLGHYMKGHLMVNASRAIAGWLAFPSLG